jgi:single-strand DNA-binding protein
MNRVVLAGRLAGAPKIAYTPCGIAVATFRLHVPRTHPVGPQGLREPVIDEIDCLAFRDVAIDLVAWGEDGCRVNLEGRLRSGEHQADGGHPARGPHVLVDHAYEADLVLALPTASAVAVSAPRRVA